MTYKGRPKKIRYIQKMPAIVQFSPRGRPGRPDEVEITLDEFEAIKLADHQGFDQSQGAKAMRISRPSFGRILRDARKKVANALVRGNTIRIRMGSAQVGVMKQEITAEIINQQPKNWRGMNKRIVKHFKQISNLKNLDGPKEEYIL